MKKVLEITLGKLLAAAAKTPERPVAMRYGFDTRVIAAWKAQERGSEWNFAFLKPAFICAFVLVTLSFAAHERLTIHDTPDEMAIAESVIRLSMNR